VGEIRRSAERDLLNFKRDGPLRCGALIGVTTFAHPSQSFLGNLCRTSPEGIESLLAGIYPPVFDDENFCLLFPANGSWLCRGCFEPRLRPNDVARRVRIGRDLDVRDGGQCGIQPFANRTKSKTDRLSVSPSFLFSTPPNGFRRETREQFSGKGAYGDEDCTPNVPVYLHQNSDEPFLHRLLIFSLFRTPLLSTPIFRNLGAVKHRLTEQVVELRVPEPGPFSQTERKGRFVLQVENEVCAFGPGPPLNLLNLVDENFVSILPPPRPSPNEHPIFIQRGPPEPEGAIRKCASMCIERIGSQEDM